MSPDSSDRQSLAGLSGDNFPWGGGRPYNLQGDGLAMLLMRVSPSRDFALTVGDPGGLRIPALSGGWGTTEGAVSLIFDP